MKPVCEFHRSQFEFYMKVDTIEISLPMTERGGIGEEVKYFEKHYHQLGYTIKYFDRNFPIGHEYSKDGSYKTIE